MWNCGRTNLLRRTIAATAPPASTPVPRRRSSAPASSTAPLHQLSHHRIKGAVPPDLRRGVGDWVFGCDVCQEVCPWNRKAPAATEAAMRPQPDLESPDLIELLGLSEEEFRRRFRGTALMRSKRRGLLRNAAFVLGNIGDDRAMPALRRAWTTPNRWSARRRRGPSRRSRMRSRQRDAAPPRRRSLLLLLPARQAFGHGSMARGLPPASRPAQRLPASRRSAGPSDSFPRLHAHRQHRGRMHVGHLSNSRSSHSAGYAPTNGSPTTSLRRAAAACH